MTVFIRSLLLALMAAGPALASAPEPIVTARYERSVRGTIDGFPFLLLRGTHAERGEAHGYLGGKDIVRTCDSMAAFLAAAGFERDKVLPMLEQFDIPQRYRDEVEGMMRGLKMALPDAADRMLESRGREIDLSDLLLVQAGDVLEVSRCSQFSAWGDRTADGRLIIGRNWDYPAVFPRETTCIVAIDPDEDGLQTTIDAMWFGMVGGGLGSLREDGLYIAANSGGSAVKDGSFTKPVPGALLMRTCAETAPAVGTADFVVNALRNRLVLPIILHVVPPGAGSNGILPVAIEYTPHPNMFGVRARGPADGQSILLMANHFINTPEDLEMDRSGKMGGALKNCVDMKTPVGFEQAVTVLHSANQGGGTYYSLVLQPARRLMRVAVSKPGKPATESRFATIRWDAVFSAK